jgi:hypothetical protein
MTMDTTETDGFSEKEDGIAGMFVVSIARYDV